MRFEGRILAPGALMDAASLPLPTVVLECAGAIGDGRGHRRRELLWILWDYDWTRGAWVELGRAAAFDWSWKLSLREAVLAALYRPSSLVDVIERGATLAGEVIETLDRKIARELAAVQANALHSVYDQVAGRIASLA